ncbi:MAG: biotin--[acetyl-CoA-carboxylase] ligase [Clostridia bacterium]|nr:biotin--[acetyl-CoA-carboxylase] ligase [Clostridia bacterium]
MIKKQNKDITPIVLGTVDSTNSVAKAAAVEGAPEGTVIIANRQTAGRGRLGRSFVSKSGGVYMSLVLRPDISPADTLFITVAAAVAAARAIEAVSNQKCEIKWVNDIYINDKKVCGILTEGEINADGTLNFAVLGVGINLFKPQGGFPSNLPLASSVFNKKGIFLNKNVQKSKIIAEFCKNFFNFYKNLKKKDVIKEYQSRSFLTNKQITYTKNGKTQSAVVLGIDDNANLIVKGEGDTEILSHGEIQIVGMEQPAV